LRNVYTKELLEPVIKDSLTWADVCRKLNVKPYTGAQTHVKKRTLDFKIDCSHFLGQAFNKGKILGSKHKIEYYLKKNSTINSDTLKKRLFKEGIKQKKCENCGITKWKGLPAPLELDHINNDHWDNRLKNLKILCPNCHSIKNKG